MPKMRMARVTAAELISIYLYPKKENQDEHKKITMVKDVSKTITTNENLLYQKGFFQGSLPTMAKLRPIRITVLINRIKVEVIVSSFNVDESLSGFG